MTTTATGDAPRAGDTSEALQSASADGQAFLESISRWRAMIDLSLDGIILDANEKFLAVTGYEKHELVGKHHRMLAGPEGAESREYLDLWAILRRGETTAAEVLRYGKGGKPIWFGVTYYAILDKAGRAQKIIKVASDISETKRARIARDALQDDIRVIFDAAATGDLTHRLDGAKYDAESAQFAERLNAFLDSISESFGHVKAAVEQISQASLELKTTSQLMASSSLQLSRAAVGASTSLGEATSMIKANADNAALASALVTETSKAAESGQQRMEEMNGAMQAISAAAAEIARIIKVIDEIAFQTNLLALNAAVEAARAGRHGKGFAVVAHEVRSLAERSANAAKETADLIANTARRVNDGVAIAVATRQALADIGGGVLKVVDLAAEIAAASREEARKVESVLATMTEVTGNAQSGSEQSTEVSAAAEQMGRQMDLLRKRVEAYKLQDLEARAGADLGLSPELLSQLMTLLASKGLIASPKGRTPLPASSAGAAAVRTSHAAAAVDPRQVLPLDRDERGFKGF